MDFEHISHSVQWPSLAPLGYLAIRRITIFLEEWIFYYFLLRIISDHRDRGLIPKIILLLFGFFLVRQYYNLGVLEESFNIYHPEQFSLAYLAFRQIAVTLDLLCSLRLLYWLHYETAETDWLVLVPVWVGTLFFNGIGVHYLKHLEQSHDLYGDIWWVI